MLGLVRGGQQPPLIYPAFFLKEVKEPEGGDPKTVVEEGGGTSRNHSNVLQWSFLWSRVLGKLIVLGSFHPHLLRISYTTCQAARV